MSLRLDGIFNRGNENGVFHHGDDDASGGEIYNDLFAGRFRGFLGRERAS